MRLKADLFPYPVLFNGSDDYTSGFFSTNIDVINKRLTSVDLNIEFNLRDNEEIKKRLDNGEFSYAVHVEGVSSSFRELKTLGSRESVTTITLHSDLVSSKVEVNTMIIANEVIEFYQNSSFNSEYYGEGYSVRKIVKGDIIAHDEMKEVQFTFENKEELNADSIIRVSAKKDKYMSIDTDQDFIQVSLPEKAYDTYVTLSKRDKVLEKLLLTTIVQPSLMYVIDKIKSKSVDQGYRWYEAFEKILNECNHDIDNLDNVDSLHLAQSLLDMPVEDSLLKFSDWGDSNE